MHDLKKRFRLILTGLAITIAMVLGVSHTAFAGTVTVQEHLSTGYCMNDPQDSTTNGTAINLWECTNDQNQAANSVQIGSNPATYELLIGPGMCLTDPSGGGDNTPVEIWTCNQNSNQLWKYVNNGYTEQWINKTTGLAINDAQNLSTDGNGIVVWDYTNDKASQEWDWGLYD